MAPLSDRLSFDELHGHEVEASQTKRGYAVAGRARGHDVESARQRHPPPPRSERKDSHESKALHFGQGLKNNNDDGVLMATSQGTWANAQLSYWGRSFVRGGPKHFGGGTVENLYENVISARCDNPTVRRSVDGVLACVLGREAAARRGRLTMEELLRENRRLEVDLKGLEA